MSSSSMYAANRRQQTWSNQHQLRKQRSFIESTAVASRILCQVSDRGRGGRGSTNRSGSLILARLPSERNKFSYLQKQRTVVDQVCAGIRGRGEQRSRGYSLIGSGGRGSGTGRIGGKDATAGGVKIAWTNNSFDSGDAIEISGHSSQAGSVLGSIKKDFTSRSFMSDRLKKPSSCASSKPDNKINLSIVLSQTIRATENEVANSDIESSSESADTSRIASHVQKSDTKKSPPEVLISKPQVQQERRLTSAAQRRAQFQSSRGEQISTSSTPTIPSTTIPLSASPSLTIQQRPPLVRAMSAPVRSLDDTTKNILANNKRKTRRRRIITRNSSCDKSEIESSGEVSVVGPNGKKILSRSRSTVGSDVITLVSLISSEGSDSEKEDCTSVEETQSGRAPLLRKTGKSVSFQENDEPNYQMAVKEFPHMLRRGSIAPLAARLRSNRPPTAPPVSIFLSDYENCTVKMSELEKITNKDDLSNAAAIGKENTIFIKTAASGESAVDFDFPEYVRSNKERECWKLFQKMSKKGVTVTYDTVLRGMLTPTEFRQLQKQREFENAKAKEAEEAEAAANVESKILIIGKK